MLQPIRHLLSSKRIVLASGSPRRQELVQNMGLLDVELCPSLFEENLDPKDFPNLEGFVEETALQKVLEVYERMKDVPGSELLVMGADTVVVLDGHVYGKPKTKEVAFDTLKRYLCENVIWPWFLHWQLVLLGWWAERTPCTLEWR